jgi:hypothetical protein
VTERLLGAAIALVAVAAVLSGAVLLVAWLWGI